MDKLIYVLNGPNLNLLGKREPETYGRDTLADVEVLCREAATKAGLAVLALQSNSESQLIDWIHEAREQAAAIVINPGGLSHTSVSLRDALAAFEGPILEVHVSNIHAREEFRHHSYVSSVAAGVVCGCGIRGYEFGVRRVADLLKAREENKNAA